jgi:hypothetical protein
VSEPNAVAAKAHEVVPGVWWWSVHDNRIDFLSAAHAVAAAEGVVLIDPLPLESEELTRLGEPVAICLTAGIHQRSAWRYRRELGIPVHAPATARQIEEEPDVRYSEGDELPGGLRPFFTPGGGTTQHTFLLERESGVAFVPDLFTHLPERGLLMVRDEYMHDPAEARRSARKLLDLPFSILCLNHGTPLVDDPKGAIQSLLEES